MKKSICLFAITAIFFIVGYNVYIKTIDTKYAVKFAQAFKNYDINDIDKYFSKDTQFIYKELYIKKTKRLTMNCAKT